MGELEFQQRWEFRRNEDDNLDSSCDDSKSSSGQLFKKHKLVSSLNSVGDDETSETSRLKQKDNDNPGTGGHRNIGKAKKRKTRNVSNNLQNSKMKKDSPEEVDLQKDETSAHDDPAPLNDLKNFMESLLKDLKVTRQNLLKWMLEEMQKLVADDTTPERKRKKRGQQIKKSKKVQEQHEKTHKESIQFQHPNNSEKSIQVQYHTNFQETVFAQQQNNFQENIKLQVQQLQELENINRQHQNDFKYGMITQNGNSSSLVRFPEGTIAANSTDYFHALGDRVDSGQVTEFITSSNKNKRDSLSISSKPILQTSSDQYVQVQSDKSVVLAIEAQKGKGGSLKRSSKGKKLVDRRDHSQVPEDQGGHDQTIRTAVADTNGEKLGSSIVQNFLSSPSGQAPSSMYLKLPTVLTEPIVANHGLHASLCNYFLPRVAETKGGVNSERVNQMLEPSSNQRSFPVIQPEERVRSFTLMGSRNMGSVNQNNTPTSGIGTGFPVPLHQGIDVGLSIPGLLNPQSLSQENSKPLGLRMNGGAVKFSGGSYNLSEHIAANNYHGLPAYKSDGRLMSYQIQNIKDGHHFLQMEVTFVLEKTILHVEMPLLILLAK
ncbi:uncharacterized protein LOC111290084 [Durio zibethinus]|uniref:Uncharacterized protein LOC111290084 n=1 Tax=Durio zibethinus TaxID=66656 RepID=A0A6P5YA14_DURZI|nr:uncharacterized protein LOC111290084 [Durio zibethinus]